jgi:hypothetical protein
MFLSPLLPNTATTTTKIEAKRRGLKKGVKQLYSLREEAATRSISIDQLQKDYVEAKDLDFGTDLDRLYAYRATADELSSAVGYKVGARLYHKASKKADAKGISVLTILQEWKEAGVAVGEETGVTTQKALDDTPFEELHALKEEAVEHQAHTGGSVKTLLEDKAVLRTHAQDL